MLRYNDFIIDMVEWERERNHNKDFAVNNIQYSVKIHIIICYDLFVAGFIAPLENVYWHCSRQIINADFPASLRQMNVERGRAYFRTYFL